MKMGIILIAAGVLLAVSGVVVMARQNSSPEPEPTAAKSSAARPEPRPEPAQLPEPAATDGQRQPSSQSPVKSPKQKGNEFEEFLADILAASGISIKEWNQGTVTEAGTMAENALNPDFFVAQSHEGTDLSYWIETKWRSKFPDSGFSFKPGQLDRYRKTQRESRRKVFLFLGFGGTPKQPDECFWVPLDSLTDEPLSRDRISRFYMSDPQRHLKGRVHNYFINKVFKKKS